MKKFLTAGKNLSKASQPWFILQFKPNAHRLAERNLRRQGFETFLPLQEVTRVGVTRFTKDLRPLFPGYMFVAFEPQTGPWKKINSTIGVSKLVSFDSRPKSVPWGLVSDLMLRCDAAGKLLPPKQCTKGDAVKLLSGPFAEFIATVEDIDPQKRVWVLMDFLGRTSRISVSPEQLQVIE